MPPRKTDIWLEVTLVIFPWRRLLSTGFADVPKNLNSGIREFQKETLAQALLRDHLGLHCPLPFLLLAWGACSLSPSFHPPAAWVPRPGLTWAGGKAQGEQQQQHTCPGHRPHGVHAWRLCPSSSVARGENRARQAVHAPQAPSLPQAPPAGLQRFYCRGLRDGPHLPRCASRLVFFRIFPRRYRPLAARSFTGPPPSALQTGVRCSRDWWDAPTG